MRQLSLRQTAISGIRIPDDYCAIHEGRSVGRIRLAEERRSDAPIWTWAINVPLPIPSWGTGSASDFEGAKGAFSAVWARFYADLSPDDITHWHRTADARSHA